jgi:hypothetical protein
MWTVRMLDGRKPNENRVPYNLAAQSLVKLVKLALHGRDIRLLEQ